MAVTLTSTGITFSDGTSQSSAGADWNTLANRPDDLVRFSYTSDYHSENLTAGAILRDWPRTTLGGSCCSQPYNDRIVSNTPIIIGSGMTGNFRVRFRGYRQEGNITASIFNGETRLAHHSWGSGCCWQTMSTTGYYNFSLAPGEHTLTPWLGTNMSGVSMWMEYQLEFVSWS